jgi:acetyl-CoA carboxylase carboxyl transferase subunit alpha
MHTYLDFEKPLSDIEGKIHELQKLAGDGEIIDTSAEIEKLKTRAGETLAELYSKLTPWQKTQVARHPDRPHFVDYVGALIDEFTPLAGDRKYANDEAIQAGFGRFRGEPVAIIGQEKGHDTETRIRHNFGSARPEGYRKAVRLMELADRFKIPVLTLIDTSGAYPGVGAEERGQAEAIARSTEACLNIKVPIVSVILGEGGSGGAIAIATADRVYMLEHAIYSVISPEGAASILWRDATRAKDAATNMKITAQDLKALGIIDDIISEPVGGAHRGPQAVVRKTGDIIAAAFADLGKLEGDQLRQLRRQKYLNMGHGA